MNKMNKNRIESNNRISFVTIMNIYNVHLTKDVGLIPFGMSKYFDYESYCATYDNPPYSNLKYVPGLKIWRVKKITGNYDFDAFLFLIKNARRIGILNIYHQRRWSALYIYIYKLINPKGHVYWKLDGGEFDKEGSKIKSTIYAKVLKKCNLVSTEILDNANRQTRFTGEHISYIPNPLDPNIIRSFLPFEERNNTILTVGRLGCYQKATEVLMDGFRISCQNISKDWKLRLVGPIEKHEIDFQNFIDEWFIKYPEMRKRMEFVGEISDRGQLLEEYRKAKIFVLPSRSESFGLALIEAGANGDFIISTDIPSFKSITCDFEFAESFPIDDVETLANKIEKSRNIPRKELEKKANEIQNRMSNNYSLESCCIKIQKSLNI